MDLTLKPSLARYDMRPDKQGAPYMPPVERAGDDAEYLLALVERDCAAALAKQRNGELRQAVAVLRRAYSMASGHPRTKAGEVHPVARLAVAGVRLQLCAVLSQLDRHEQALGEARAAKIDTEEIWRGMQDAQIEYEAGTAAGDPSRPPAPWRNLLRKPPPWLTKAIEVSVQARQCIALELEFLVQEAEHGKAGTGGELGDLSPPKTPTPGSSIHEGWPRPQATLSEEAAQLHVEAAELASSLLSTDSEVRARAEQGMREAEARGLTRCHTTGRLHSDPGTSATSALVRQLTLLSAPAPSCGLVEASSRLSSGSASGRPKAAMWLDMLPAELTYAKKAVPKLERSDSHAEWVRAAPPGDLFNRSLPWVRAAPRTPGSRASRRSSSSGSRVVPPLQNSRAPLVAVEREDAFKDWKRAVMKVNQMTLRQRKMQSLDGMKDLKEDLKVETRRNHVLIKELDDEHLYENRLIYTSHSIMIAQKAQQKWEDRKTVAPKDLLRKEEEKELFEFYGVSLPDAGPGTKHLRKLLKESIERSPQGRQQRVREEAERRRRAAEEEERVRQDLRNAFAMKA